jgi:isopenicillin N synthase-like dioxygenase
MAAPMARTARRCTSALVIRMPGTLRSFARHRIARGDPMNQTIPVLDLADLRRGFSRARLADELRQAFTEVGFYFVRNHGVAQEILDDTFEAARRFHDLPLDEKLKIRRNEHNIGYMPMRGSTTNINALGGAKTKPNVNESIFFKRELAPDHPDVIAGIRFRATNQWPASFPEMRRPVLACCNALEALGRSLLPLYALALGQSEDFFDQAFAEPMYTLRLSHYPQQEATAPEDEFGIAPHVDTSFMTILAQNKVPGLSLRLPGGQWIDAPAPEGALLVNGGMLLRRWSNGRFLATPHRVINRSGQERYAIPFFMDARHDAVMTPIPRADRESEKPITYAEFMADYVAANFAPPAATSVGAGEVQMQGA